MSDSVAVETSNTVLLLQWPFEDAQACQMDGMSSTVICCLPAAVRVPVKSRDILAMYKMYRRGHGTLNWTVQVAQSESTITIIVCLSQKDQSQ